MTKISAASIAALALSSAIAAVPLIQGQKDKPTPPPATLDDAQLKQMLTGLGYDPKPLANGCFVAYKKNDWTYYVQFTLSQDKSRLGLNANLGKVSDPAKVTADQWMVLLEQNAQIDPSSFYYNGEAQTLYLHRVLENRGLTSAYVEQQIENFCANIHDTAAYWSFAK